MCGTSGVQIHHINSDPSDNAWANLAVLCLPHHDEATAPDGLTAKLRPSEIEVYKTRWEGACAERMSKGARRRTAFWMVDYKNAERLRQLFGQLSEAECEQAYQVLSRELREETAIRKEKGWDLSIEPTLIWSRPVEHLLDYLRDGSTQPAYFGDVEGHPKDPLLPSGPAFADVRVPIYDIWCQMMARALVAVRSPFVLEDLLALDDPLSAGLEGALVAFEARLSGTVYRPEKWREHPVGKTRLYVRKHNTTFQADLHIKTHYVYSDTAAEFLGKGRSIGLLMVRSIDDVTVFGKKRVVDFSATPLLIGSGGGGLLEIA